MIWNERIEYPYYLAFAPESARKISYAASFGKSKLESDEVNETRRLLKRYDSVLNKYNPKIVGQLTLPVDILEKKYGASTGIVHAAYTDWLLMKLKHICFRAYLAEENTDPFNKKVSEFSKVLHTAPWIEVLNRRNTQPFKKRLKFFLYDIKPPYSQLQTP